MDSVELQSIWIVAAIVLLLAAESATSNPLNSRSTEIARQFNQFEDELKLRASSPKVLPDYSSAGIGKLRRELIDDQHRLNKIERDVLPQWDKVKYDVRQWQFELKLDKTQYPLLSFPYTPYEFTLRGPNAILQKFELKELDTLNGYLRLLRSYSNSLESIIALIKEQTSAGIYLQKDAVLKTRKILRSTISLPEESFAMPSEERLRFLPLEEVVTFKKSVRHLIENQINPEISRLISVFSDQYIEKAPTKLGLWQYPNGRKYYKILIREWLTLDRDPEYLFNVVQYRLDGIQSELAALRAQMKSSLDRVDFDRQIAFSKKFTARNPQEVERIYRKYMGRIDPLLENVFCRKPLFGYITEQLPEKLEAALNYGYADVEYRPEPVGIFYYNASQLSKKSLITAQGLIYHELSPGHYWHAAMSHAAQAEMGARPTIDTHSHLGFAEAWADYAQLLAYELGVFRTPEERYGRLLFVSMFLTRALTDIGVNYFARDREWAVGLLNEHTIEPPTVNEASLLRDTTDWQAQILPYSLGSMALVRLREKVREALGKVFDLPRFHDAVLSTWGVPIPVLDRHLEWFANQELRGGAEGICQ